MDKLLYGKIKGFCRKCGCPRLHYYDGALGYEAIVCDECGTHHSNAEPILLKIRSTSDEN